MSHLPVTNFADANIARPNSSGRRDLSGVIARSAQRTGVDFQYLVAQAQLESGMRADAKAQTSSATGLYQFIDQTWLGLIKDKGDKYGLGWAQNAISRNRNGYLSVADKAQKSSILALRNDPQLSADLAGDFASDNSDYLERKTGRTPQSVDLYLAHFLGPAGAAKFLNKMDENPDGAAARAFPEAARANRNIFFNRAGQANSFETIRNRFAHKLADAVNLVGNGLPVSGKTLPPSAGRTQPLQDARRGQMVQPADYLRIARAHAGQDQANKAKPFNEPARAAYLMLATLGI
ncbi:lytic transglycosylase domain-containing protein [Parasphingorhabdus sp. JC815]|uniref:lytic transglycosylase domain-containing protein n=1 Tax=Parasphingorhabdus sp. JC815 TaxID=3232140 RepID=UPI003458F561